jgi:integrase
VKRSSIPSYLPHNRSGRARAVWTDPVGRRHDRLLPGKFESAESRAAYARLVAELASPAIAVDTPADTITVNQLLLAYLQFAETYYVGTNGKPSREYVCMKTAIRPVRELYGTSRATAFGPLALRAVRQHMIAAGLCRTSINHHIERVKRVFRWAASEEMVPIGSYESLRTLAGLRKGRTEAAEAEPVKPVAEETVKATLPFLPAHVRAMVELMQHTGMRPGEAAGMTLAQIDRSGSTWLYRPVLHKTAHTGRERVIALGPKARAVLVAHLAGRSFDPNELIFSPKRARDERFEKMRAGRKSKVQPSQEKRGKGKPKRSPKDGYVSTTISHAVRVAARKAKVEHWHPYQLRHTHATKVRKAFGLEHAGAALGHSRMSATEIYAERDAGLAIEVAKKLG